MIGNAEYKIGPLANPVNDAAAVAEALGKLGFDKVIVRQNLGFDAFRAALKEMSRESAGAKLGVVYFAGHGMEVKDKNFLIPVDAKLAKASDLSLEAVALHQVLDQLVGVTGLKLVILDACRNNPFPAAKRGARGLARIEPEDNTLVVYAAKEGTTAEDGVGRKHSPFTEALLKHIAAPGVEIRLLFGRVRDDVVAATYPPQYPHVYGTLGGKEFHFKPKREGQPPTDPTPPPSAREAAPLTPAEERALKPRDSFKECNVCPEMVVVPTGSFMMGSPANEKDRHSDEGPQRNVTIARLFAAGKFEVTFAEWDACAAAGRCERMPGDEGWGRGKRPVINVSWKDADKYASWLSHRTGKTYRLLTEAEWEYAARGGAVTPFATGSSITTNVANFDGNYSHGGNAKGLNRDGTVEVGSFPANAFGLHDMHGNVWEWVQDCYQRATAAAPSDGTAVASEGCSERVLRGGSWANRSRALRSAFRDHDPQAHSSKYTGFRVARTLSP